jgi:hypothetical protein
LISVKLLIKSIQSNHRLLKKPRSLGLSDNAISWFASYLHDRAQCVSIGGKCSSWLDVNSGVLQGSTLGPLLFSLYINDICGNLKYCRHHLFCDDCQIYYSFHPDDIYDAVGTVNEDLMQGRISFPNFGGIFFKGPPKKKIAAKTKLLTLKKKKKTSGACGIFPTLLYGQSAPDLMAIQR